MLNLVKTRPGIVADPDSGEALGGAAWLGRYSRVFVRGPMRRGGHPLFVGRKVGGYIDAWNTPADPGWTLFGTMRYRRSEEHTYALQSLIRSSYAVSRLKEKQPLILTSY